MDINLNNLSSLSQRIEKKKNFKSIYSKLPSNYIGLISNKPIIESFCYLNKDGTESDNIFNRNREIISFNKFMEKLSRSNKQIEEERKEYLKKLKYFNAESDELAKLKQIKRFENVMLYQRLNNLLELRQHKIRIDKKRKVLQNQSSINSNDSSINDSQKIFRIHINKRTRKLSKKYSNSVNNNKYLTIDKTKLNESSSKRTLGESIYRPLLKNFSSNHYSKIRIIKNNQENKQNEKISIIKDKIKNINKQMNIIRENSYEKQWNKPKGLIFSKILGRNRKIRNFNKYRIIKKEKDYSPKYDYILPDTNRRKFYFGDKGHLDLNKFKILSTKKAIFNYINNNYSFDDNYNIMNLINIIREKKRLEKQVKLNDNDIYNLLSEYLNKKKEEMID